MVSWNLSLEQWILEDGNYNGVDFSVGSEIQFAVVAYAPSGLKALQQGEMKARHCSEAAYEINGKVVWKHEQATILDIGSLSVYHLGEAINQFEEGGFAAGKVELSVDPYHYYEMLGAIPGVPPIIFTWKIDRIVMVSERTTEPHLKVSGQQNTVTLYNKESSEIQIDMGLYRRWILECSKRSNASSPPSNTLPRSQHY